MDRQWWEAAISGRGKRGKRSSGGHVEGFREVVRDAQAHDRETIAVVAHGGTIMSIMERYAVKEDGTPAGSYYDYQIKNGEGYELRISENDIYDDRDRGGLCSGSDLRGSKMAVSSGVSDRKSDRISGKNTSEDFSEKQIRANWLQV